MPRLDWSDGRAQADQTLRKWMKPSIDSLRLLLIDHKDSRTRGLRRGIEKERYSTLVRISR